YGSPLHSPRRGWTLPLAVAGRIPGASGPMSSSRNSMIVSLRSRIGLATLAALLLIAVAWTCSRSGEPVADDAQAEDMRQEGMLQIALNGDIRSTNPGVNRDANTDTVMMHIVEGLVAYRENGVPAPLLARSVQVSDDGMSYSFALRDDVRFHNDAPLTADD